MKNCPECHVRRGLNVDVAQGISSRVHRVPNRNVVPQTVTGDRGVILRGKRSI